MVFSRWMRPIAVALSLMACIVVRAEGQAKPAVSQAAQTKPAAGYGGTAYCVQRHKKEATTFRGTAKGDLFMTHPRTEA